MRIDKYLKVSRLIKRRSVAKDATDASRISINDKVVKPSKEVKVGDIVSIEYGKKVVIVKVTSLISSTKKEDANLMFELISETQK